MYLSISASITAFKIANRDFSFTSESHSVGHICWVGEYEWFHADGKVFTAHKTNVIDVTTGNRAGRFEAAIKEILSYPKSFNHLGQFVAHCQNGLGESVGK